MAELGAVGNTHGGCPINLILATRPFPTWLFGGTLITLNLQAAIDITGALSGIANRQGVPVQDAWIRLYYRPTGQQISQVRSSSDGSFVFGPTLTPYVGLDKTVSDYFILTNDPESEFNAVIYDLLTPV
jgi:hypothetical protein